MLSVKQAAIMTVIVNIKKSISILMFGLLGLTFVMVWFWLTHTPPGLDGKLHAIGYSVCHQIPSHSFQIGTDPFPICSRCTGMYLGVFSGVVILLMQRKRLIIPSKWQFVFFALLIVAWVIDGGNSFLVNSLGRVPLYQPANSLRFLAGFGMGLCIAVTIFFLFNFVVWKKPGIRQLLKRSILLQMVLAGIIFLVLINWQNEILMKLFSYISVMTILLLLLSLYAIIWIIILHKENSFSKWKDLSFAANLGFIFALGQIILLDLLRFTLTGSWVNIIK
jgi:uncharacterized membrane protein